RHLGPRPEALSSAVRALHEDLRAGQGLLRDRLPAAPLGSRAEGDRGARAAAGGRAALPARECAQSLRPQALKGLLPLSSTLMEASRAEYLAPSPWPAPRRQI